MRRVPIRSKVAGALALPLLVLVAVAALAIDHTWRRAEDIQTETDLARAVIGPAGLITTLQAERGWAAVQLVGYERSVEVPVRGYGPTRRATDEAARELRERHTGEGGPAGDAYDQGLGGLEGLEQLRSDIDRSRAPRDIDNLPFSDRIFDRYSRMIDPFLDGTTLISIEIEDPQLRQGVELADTVTRAIEVMSRLTHTTVSLARLSPGGVNEPEEIREIAMLQAELQGYGETLRAAGGPYAAIAVERFPTEMTAAIDEHVERAIQTRRLDLDELLAALDVPGDESFRGYQAAVHDEIDRRADELEAAAQRDRLVLAGLALAVVVATATLALLVSRSITRPLRSLTRQAKDVAGNRLPAAVRRILETPLGDDVQMPNVEPIRVKTRDEVADVAEALNTVQDSALDLAVEQAVLRRNIADSFVNLGRRNQNLLGRQLDFITELESHETDPDTLASLFRLDHLATRMRRNAESLLVLAGTDPPRSLAGPVRIGEVIRAALGEVEDYQRVTIHDLAPVTILGSAAADLSHLVAELLENALAFSPPSRSVDIHGRQLPADGSDAGYQLTLVDHGLGMSAEDLAEANRRLAGTESFVVAPSRYLGHYVAGRLAARHGLHVELGGSPDGGVTATIEIAPALLTTEPATVAEPARPAAAGTMDRVGAPAPGFPAEPGEAAAPARGRDDEVQQAEPSTPEPSRPLPASDTGDDESRAEPTEPIPAGGGVDVGAAVGPTPPAGGAFTPADPEAGTGPAGGAPTPADPEAAAVPAGAEGTGLDGATAAAAPPAPGTAEEDHRRDTGEQGAAVTDGDVEAPAGPVDDDAPAGPPRPAGGPAAGGEPGPSAAPAVSGGPADLGAAGAAEPTGTEGEPGPTRRTHRLIRFRRRRKKGGREGPPTGQP